MITLSTPTSTTLHPLEPSSPQEISLAVATVQKEKPLDGRLRLRHRDLNEAAQGGGPPLPAG